MLLELVVAPMWIRLPVVGVYAVAAVGLAAVALMRIGEPALALTVGLGVGVASLVIFSLVPLLLVAFSGVVGLALQVLTVLAVSAWILRGDLRRDRSWPRS